MIYGAKHPLTPNLAGIWRAFGGRLFSQFPWSLAPDATVPPNAPVGRRDAAFSWLSVAPAYPPTRQFIGELAERFGGNVLRETTAVGIWVCVDQPTKSPGLLANSPNELARSFSRDFRGLTAKNRAARQVVWGPGNAVDFGDDIAYRGQLSRRLPEGVSMRRLVCLMLVTPIGFASGCLFVPYGVGPMVSYVPAAQTGTPLGSVHAFRVDSQLRHSRGSFPSDSEIRQLTPIALDSAAATTAQMRWSCLRGTLVTGIWRMDWQRDTIAVRLYRRGFNTVELKAWESGKEVVWCRADTLEAQAKAIDDLLGSSFVSDGFEFNERLAAGSVAEGHRRALLFAADEYTRLAAAVSDDEDGAVAQRHSWLEKAQQLRKRAAEKDDRTWWERFASLDP